MSLGPYLHLVPTSSQKEQKASSSSIILPTREFVMPENNSDDVVIEVRLPLRDYKMLRDMLDERQAMNGLKKWITSRIIWIAAGIISVVGAFEALRRFGEYAAK